MAQGTVNRNAQPGAVAAVLPDDVIRNARLAYSLLGGPDDVRDELDRINNALHTFWSAEPDWALRAISGLTTRLTEIERLLFRAESTDRKYTRIRTMECRPLLDECDRQAKIHSRLMEARRLDMMVEGIR